MRILVIEDNLDVAASICDYLEEHGHVVDAAPDGLVGLNLAGRETFDAVVLDLTLPYLDGLEVCRRLRRQEASPAILMLTARDAVQDKLDGFESGADDYLVKPFALPELEVRLRVLGERGRRASVSRELRFADVLCDLDRREVRRSGRVVSTTRAGRRILELLIRNAHRVVTRAELEQLLWPYSPPASDVLRTHIHALRKALDRPGETSLIRTVTGEGYQLVDGDG